MTMCVSLLIMIIISFHSLPRVGQILMQTRRRICSCIKTKVSGPPGASARRLNCVDKCSTLIDFFFFYPANASALGWFMWTRSQTYNSIRMTEPFFMINIHLSFYRLVDNIPWTRCIWNDIIIHQSVGNISEQMSFIWCITYHKSAANKT